MKNILVTGGCGFIGANFIHYLFKQSDFYGRVVNVDKLTYAGNIESLDTVAGQYDERYRFVHADICDAGMMARVFAEYQIDTVCHFAAESHVDRSIAAPDAFVQTNIMGTFTLLEQARLCRDRLALFHHISTDEVFGELGPEGAFTERTPYDPSSPYSASKAGSDHLVRAYSRTYGLPVTISNCSNNYGPYQFPEKLIPLMVLNAFEGKALPVYGDGSNVRDWLYVTDHCSAIWRIMQEGTRGETYNIGGRCEKTNLEVVKTICRLVDEMAAPLQGGPRQGLLTYVKDRPGHDFRYAIDCTKIERELNWHPQQTFETGLRRTIEWYLSHQNWVGRVRSGAYQDWIKSHYKETAGGRS